MDHIKIIKLKVNLNVLADFDLKSDQVYTNLILLSSADYQLVVAIIISYSYFGFDLDFAY